MIWGAIVVAAGRGTRFGRPKQLVELAGKPMWRGASTRSPRCPRSRSSSIVTEPELIERVEALVAPAGAPTSAVRSCRAVRPPGQRLPRARGALARRSRRCWSTTARGRWCGPPTCGPGCVPVRPGTAALLATPVVDTIKVAGPDGKVTRTLDRATLWAAQTPQFATARDLRRAHAEALRHGLPPATDDAALLERAGLDVVIVEGAAENFKVTLPHDLAARRALLRERAPLGAVEEEVLVDRVLRRRARGRRGAGRARGARRAGRRDRSRPAGRGRHPRLRDQRRAARLRHPPARARRRGRALHRAPLAPRPARRPLEREH